MGTVQCMMVNGLLEKCTAREYLYTQVATGIFIGVLISLLDEHYIWIATPTDSLFHLFRYEGEFQNDMKEGYGILQYVNGERYEGAWKNNFAHGHGTLLYADGDKYVGDWTEGKKSGIGELLYVNGDKFHGSWVDDKASGEGVLEYANGDVYDGDWSNDQRHGNNNHKN